MAIYLTIDTSAGIEIGVVAKSAGVVKVLAFLTSADTRHHAENLTPMVKEALSAANISRADAIIAGRGPAAFTGLRAGLVTARTLAAVWDVPLYGLSSLEALALAGVDAGANIVVPVIDARRKEVYALRARAMGPDDLEILSEAEVISPELLTQNLDAAPAVVVKHLADESLYPGLGCDEQIVTVSPDIWVRLLLSRQSRCDAGESVDLSSEPLYLRRPDVHAGAHAQPHAQGNPYEHKAQ